VWELAEEMNWGGSQKRGTGGEIETPNALTGRGMERSDLLPSRLECLGERRKLPERGPGRSPGQKRVFGVFCNFYEL